MYQTTTSTYVSSSPIATIGSSTHLTTTSSTSDSNSAAPSISITENRRPFCFSRYCVSTSILAAPTRIQYLHSRRAHLHHPPLPPFQSKAIFFPRKGNLLLFLWRINATPPAHPNRQLAWNQQHAKSLHSGSHQ
mmetsp:Transcript_37991/g.66623  ORF Transcript_37991/g.66623 Transcript_37991/m.66623 type:complete len:134 (+) Transcript_37991:101-502(+)